MSECEYVWEYENSEGITEYQQCSDYRLALWHSHTGSCDVKVDGNGYHEPTAGCHPYQPPFDD